MVDSNISELLNIFYQRFDSFQALWNIYSSIVFGIIAALIAFPKHLNPILIRVIIIVGFWVFAFANLGSLTDIQKDRLRLLNELQQRCDCFNPNASGGIGVIERIVDFYPFDFKDENKKYKNGLKSLICNKRINSFLPIWIFHLLQDLLISVLIWFLPKRFKFKLKRKR